ncbi:hypothetical protein KEM52_003086, partial [Ascosphaera acerosa]
MPGALPNTSGQLMQTTDRRSADSAISLHTDHLAGRAQKTTAAVPVLPPTAAPPPTYIALAAASQILTTSQAEAYASFMSGKAGALVTSASLALLNAFLDYLVWAILTEAQSLETVTMRQAAGRVLGNGAGAKAVAIASDRSSDFADIDGCEAPACTAQSREKTSGRHRFQTGVLWKRLRLRCMVFTRFGDMEEEDEEEHLASEGMAAPRFLTDYNDPSFISPLTATFTTSLVEYIGETLLITSGLRARERMQSQAKEEKRCAVVPSGNAPRLTVTEDDLDQSEYDLVIKRIWNQWRDLRDGTLSLMAALAPTDDRSASTVSNTPETSDSDWTRHGSQSTKRGKGHTELHETMPCQDCSRKQQASCRDSSPDLSYYLEASAANDAGSRSGWRGRGVSSTAQTAAETTAQSPTCRQSLGCHSEHAASSGSTTTTQHACEALTEVDSDAHLEALMRGITCAPSTLSSAFSSQTTISKHFESYYLSGNGSADEKAGLLSSSPSSLDDLLARDDTIRLSYKSNQMRDMEHRRNVERRRLPASAARGPTQPANTSMRVLAEFIRTTGPEELNAGRPDDDRVSSGSRSPDQRRRQAREAVYDDAEDIRGLAEFIRQGPASLEPMTGKPASASGCRDPRRGWAAGPAQAGRVSPAASVRAGDLATPESERGDAPFDHLAHARTADMNGTRAIQPDASLIRYLSAAPLTHAAQRSRSCATNQAAAPASARSRSTVRDRMSARSNTARTTPTRGKAPSVGRSSTWSSISGAASALLSIKSAPTEPSRRRLRFRRHGKAVPDAYRDSPYGERDIPRAPQPWRDGRLPLERRAQRTVEEDEDEASAPPSLSGVSWTTSGSAGRSWRRGSLHAQRDGGLAASQMGSSVAAGTKSVVKALRGRSHARSKQPSHRPPARSMTR